MEDLLNTTTALGIACDRASTIPSLKNVARAIEQDEESFTHDERRLLDIRFVLSKARNRSTAPINLLLPPELLTYIFSLISNTGESSERKKEYPTIIASVCSSWRQLSIGTCSLWSHIILNRRFEWSNAENMLQRAQLYLARARGAPLHLDFDGRWAMSEQERNSAISLLVPHMTSLRSLNYSLNRGDLNHSILSCWLKYGTPGSLTTLSVHAHAPWLETRECLPNNSDFFYPNLDEFLRPIQILTLSEAHMDWGCAAFSGLVELNLNCVKSSASPTAAQFAGILSGSPLLRSLSIRVIKITSPEGAQVIPVKHTHLQKLDLLDLDPASFDVVCSTLLPCSGKLDLHIKADSFPHVAISLCNHWDGIRIPILRLGSRSFQVPAFQQLLSTIQGTHTLALQDTELSIATLNTLAGRSSDTTSISPELHTLEFISCSILSEEAFRKMITARPVQKLRVLECNIVLHGSWRRVNEAAELCAWLASVVPDCKIET